MRQRFAGSTGFVCEGISCLSTGAAWQLLAHRDDILTRNSTGTRQFSAFEPYFISEILLWLRSRVGVLSEVLQPTGCLHH